MIRALPGTGHPPLGGRLAVALAVATLVATLVAVGTLAWPELARGATPNATPPPAGPTPDPTLNPGQAKKAATPTPVVTPIPTPTPVVTAGPIPTVAPVAAPVASAPPPAEPIGPTATPTSHLASGDAGTSGRGAGGTVAKPARTGAPVPPPPAVAGTSSTPESTADTRAAGSTASPGSGAGDAPPVEVFLLIAIVGVLLIVGGWFIAGRRSARDEEASVAGSDRGPSARGEDPLAVPVLPAPGIGYEGVRLEDPLVAAIVRTRDARGSSGRARHVAPGPAGDDPLAFNGPTWVRRLDPEIRVIPGLRIEDERTHRIRKSEMDNRETPEATARAS